MFSKYSTQCLSPSMSYREALYFWSDLAHFEVLHVAHAAVHVLRLLAEWVARVILLQVEWSNPWILKSISPLQVSLYFSPLQVSLCLLEWSVDVLA